MKIKSRCHTEGMSEGNLTFTRSHEMTGKVERWEWREGKGKNW